MSKKLDMTKRHARRLQEQGVKLENASPIQAAKLRKTNAEIAKLEFQIEILKRSYIPLAEAEGYGMKIGQVVERFFDEGRTNWPTEHAGKTEIQLQTLYEEAESEFKERLRGAIANR